MLCYEVATWELSVLLGLILEIGYFRDTIKLSPLLLVVAYCDGSSQAGWSYEATSSAKPVGSQMK